MIFVDENNLEFRL